MATDPYDVSSPAGRARALELVEHARRVRGSYGSIKHVIVALDIAVAALGALEKPTGPPCSICTTVDCPDCYHSCCPQHFEAHLDPRTNAAASPERRDPQGGLSEDDPTINDPPMTPGEEEVRADFLAWLNERMCPPRGVMLLALIDSLAERLRECRAQRRGEHMVRRLASPSRREQPSESGISEEERARVETGPVQFGDDWPGLFIRGDDCARFMCSLVGTLRGGDDAAFYRSDAERLIELLRATDARGDSQVRLLSSLQPSDETTA